MYIVSLSDGNSCPTTNSRYFIEKERCDLTSAYANCVTYNWLTSHWSEDCDYNHQWPTQLPCGRWTQTRELQCVDSTTGEKASAKRLILL